MKVFTAPRSYGKTDPEVFTILRAAGLEVVRNETGGILDREDMKALLVDCDGAIVGVDPIDAEVIAAAPKLKAIAKYDVGVDNIDLNAAKARDTKVFRTVGANTEAVADYATVLFLAVTRKMVLADQHCRQGDWKKITTRDVTGDTIGILGLGAIGRNMAQRTQGFGMKVLAHDPFWNETCARAHDITRAAPDEIFAECDVIFLHLPPAPKTENFIGTTELAKMKPDAILVNTVRNGLIDENTLLDALEAGRLYGAGIDVFSSEPSRDPRWLTLGNVVLGSHCAASTAGASRNVGRMATTNPIHDLGLQGGRTAMKCILAHNLGTSNNKTTLFSDEEEMITNEVLRYGCHYFNTSQARQDPEDFWKAICVTSRSLIDKVHIDLGGIAAIFLSDQMMGCLCMDKQDNSPQPSIIWADQRARAQAAVLRKQTSLWDFYHTAGHRNSASYGLQKLMQVWGNEPGVCAKTYKTLNAKDPIVLRLTGKSYTEPSGAISNVCIGLNILQWSDKTVNASGIDSDKLPEIVPSTTVAGEVTPWTAEQTGLKAGTPVVIGGGDGLYSDVGADSINPGRTFSCIGTSAWVATTSEKPLFDEEMRTFTQAHIVPELYSPTGTMQAGGSSYNWLKDQVVKYETAVAKVQDISPYDLINAEAARSPVGANGIFFLPYLLGEQTPRWSPDATTAWLGLKMENQRYDLFQAVLEGVTLNPNIILESFRRSVPINELLVMGGGIKGALWYQMMADVYNARIEVPVPLEEATSMSAAVTGGVGAGMFKDFEVIDQMLELNHTVEPDPEAVTAYDPVKEAFEVCYRAMLPVYEYMVSRKNA